MTIKNLFLNPPIKEKVSIKGWVKTFRANRFISVNDGSSLQSIQCVVDYENTDKVILNKINRFRTDAPGAIHYIKKGSAVTQFENSTERCGVQN